MQFSRFVGVIVCAVALCGCSTIHNEPLNRPLAADAPALADAGRETLTYEDDLLLALSFSGGGTRAAAFSHGVLTEMDGTQVRGRNGSSLLDRVDFVSGVSGGAITAAYFGLKKRAALADFRERFLLRDAEAGLRTQVTAANLSRAFAGGINRRQRLPALAR